MIRIRVVVIAVVTGVLLAFLIHVLVGPPLSWAALIALPLAAFVLLVLATPPGVEPSWAPLPEPPSSAGYLDASTLAGRFEDAAVDQSRYRLRVQPRLAELTVATLRRKPGLADLTGLADPRAVAVLGSDWHAVLTDPAATLPPPAVLLAMLARLEEA